MIDYVYADLFKKSSIDKQIKIEYDGGQFTNTDIPDNDFEITEMLCSENNLVFGACETNSVKFTIANHGTSIVGKWLTISTVLSGNSNYPFYLGKYKVFSDKPSADRVFREIVAYDAMYDVLNTDVTDWYNSLAFPMTLKQFRDSFFDYLGIVQVFTDLPLDNLTIEKTITADILVGKDVVNAICELNGRFGNINRYGKFKYVKLETISTGLYPSDTLFPSDALFPRDKASFIDELYTGDYISCDYEDWLTNEITGLSILTKENDIGVSVGTDTNRYTITGNFLIYGKNEDELTGIANTILNEINDVSYQPFVAEKQGNPCVEVGDAIKITTNKNEIIKSYILERTMHGIQAITDSISAKGTKEIENKQNSLNSKVTALLGKSNILERNIDETKARIEDVNRGLSVEIGHTASGLHTEIQNTKEGLELQIEMTADGLTEKIAQIQKDVDNKVISYSGDYVPTLDNYPANEWTTNEIKDNHIGNVYFVFSNDENNGKTYKFKKDSNGNYFWEEVVDTQSVLALKTAQEALAEVGKTNENLVLNYKTSEKTEQYVTETFSEYDRKIQSTYTTMGEVSNYTEQKLASYYTKTETESEIRQTSNELELRVGGAQSKWILNGVSPDYSAYGEPPAMESKYYGKTYLNVETGYLYTAKTQNGQYAWVLTTQLKSTEATLNLKIDPTNLVSSIEGAADVIHFRAGKFTIESNDFSIDEKGNVTFGKNAIITWQNIDNGTIPDFALSNEVPTESDIVTITKKTVTAPYINALNIKAGSVDAENITGTKISGKTIEGGTIYGATVTTNGALKMLFPTTGERIVIEPQSPAVGDGIVFPLACYFNAYVKFSNINSTGGYNVSGNHGLYSSDMSANICRKTVVSGKACSQLGNSSYDTRIYGTNIYKGSSSTAITSDKRLKNCICSIENKYDDFFMKLNPVTFKMKNGESGRLHIGFIAQDIRDALSECDISTEDFAGYVEDVVDKEYLKESFGIDASNEKDWSDGKQLYVRYEEFIALNTHMIQKQHKEIEQLKSEIAELKEMVKALMQ